MGTSRRLGQSVTQAWPSRSLLAELPAGLRDNFLRLGSPRWYARGQVLIAEGASTTEAYVILSGFVRVINYTMAGESAMIAIRTRGDLIGELAAMDGKPRTSTIIAASRTNVLLIDGPLFRSFSAGHPEAGEAITRSVVGKLRSATRYRVETNQASVLIRVARVLEHLVEAYGRTVSEGTLIDVPLSQHDLASLVGSSEKGVYRAYDHLRLKGVIEVGYRRVTVRDMDLLQIYAADT